MRRLVALLLPLLMSCGDSGGSSGNSPDITRSMMVADNVEIGPIINGKNYSEGLPLHPIPFEGGGWTFPLGPQQEPHYVTARLGSLSGKTHIKIHYSIDLPEGEIKGAGCDGPGTLSLYFQRTGDDWNTDGWRWWFSGGTKTLAPGEYEYVVVLDGPGWTSVRNKTFETDPDDFQDAKTHTNRVGFTFGNCTGLGHGITATAPGQFRLHNFEVE